MKWKYLNLSLSFLFGFLISFLISSSSAQTINLNSLTDPNSSSTIDFSKVTTTNTQIISSLEDLKTAFNNFKLSQYQANRDLEKICKK